MKKIINTPEGTFELDLTAEEITQREQDAIQSEADKVAREKEEANKLAKKESAWEAGAYDRAMADLRQKRNRLLSATDYLALSDNTMTDDVKVSPLSPSVTSVPDRGDILLTFSSLILFLVVY